ncbi:hypothetical protein IAQ61_001959 [Plenodomus lingam]|uniref:Ubiquitin-like domain-containing protein n=1 Tax=Leptosphaeria maculans (strain JN3 / isolate v23.1.3 / race Av1-4-5-6-7-8) TaxID=985895 RepID=E4ZGN4_LEPMJ|nr:hypothetical protein LEMA_P065800.1 [Plenodomus lingam JN3]KAH9878686.1 hypothetical protein IAQ61_001959 [Plenodomus lingam]CBX90454.1 hypothetical protein LEMA_P065800.1 [Plenodomus lingam JN3]
MAEPPPTTTAPKKRSLFKRAAWQDAPKKEDEDMFSHSNEFKDIVAEQDRLREEDKRREETEAKQRKTSVPRESKSKRRRICTEDEKPVIPESESGSPVRATRRSRTPLPPASDSLAARYDSLAKSTSEGSTGRREPLIISLSDDDDDDDDKGAVNGYVALRQAETQNTLGVRPSGRPAVDNDEEVEEVLDPALAALQARARQRALERTNSAGTPAPEGEPTRIPVSQLFIDPEIPDADPLMVKVRINSTIEKPRKAWCERQGYSPDVTRGIFFTWKGTRLFDSTTIKRLGIQVDERGNVSVDGDTTLYDEDNIPKIHVKAWTEEVFMQRKREEAAEAAAKKTAAEAPLEAEQRTLTPEPEPVTARVRLVLKISSKDDFRLTVKPDTTFEHITSAYKSKLKIQKDQPVTLYFDGERLSPLDTVADAGIEDLDSIEVRLK